MRTTVTAAFVAAALLATAAPAVAESPPSDEVETSYASWTLAADGTSVALILAGFVTEGEGGRDTQASGAFMATGFLGAMVATPIVHGIHRRPDRALGSFALRATLGSLGAYVAVKSASCDPEAEMFCGLDRLGPGLLAGFVVASVIDAATMTSERRPAPSWSPVIGGNAQGVKLGVSGRF